ncbi:ribonucleases P/MRP protein subunit POP1 [Copidosoma floridanum]|uniref:ribonucleases P/MRP protein subunit POP1 n=1 Tax=Copidosoma floridanum TaxID=29053 RepID=UPI0006C9C8DE|nr:ribonucleases P/MRP protein subunit POP1 [Copidosoma floridanum]
MSDKQQFDVNLGGTEKLPKEAHIMKLATARASEMAAMTFSLKNPQQTKMIFQKLPIHMRRRVMSHNAKRMPRKLRNYHLSQMSKSGLPPKTKRPSRKYRRRPKNLLSEYNRRQRNKLWLETHIWHAKRFKMIEKWGFKLPNHSNDRCFRANYRAVAKHCLIQDLSYYTCLEIRGPVDILKEKLKRHCNQNELTFGAKIYINGEREGTLMFYKKDGYPCSPIGYVHFLWSPNGFSNKFIWLWVHPAFYSEVLQEIINHFSFELEKNKKSSDLEGDSSQEKKNCSSESTSPDLKIFSTIKIPTYNSACGCQMLILRNCLNRFRLCGPLALSILTDAFELPDIKKNSLNENKIFVDEDENFEECHYPEDACAMDVDTHPNSKQSIDFWYRTYYQSRDNLEAFKVQKDVYNTLRNLKSSNQLPPNIVVALTVLDPRFFLPLKRTKSLPSSQPADKSPMPPTLANNSPLWDSNIRSYVTKNCISTSAINKLRSQSLVPGVENDQHFSENVMHKIPILLIQKPGDYSHNNSIGFGSGVDVVLPAGWSMPFWLSLILRCAKAGGLRESKAIAYENSNLNVPAINHPDTDAYQMEAKLEKMKLIEKYFRLPPNKRVNFIKFGITSPYFCEWKLLMKEWNDSPDFYILRNQQVLSLLNAKMSSDLERKRKIAKREVDESKLLTDVDHFLGNKNCFVPVKVSVERKGTPKNFSIICIPTQEDLTKFKENKKWSGPLESLKKDLNEEKRRNSRKDHQALLRRLRRQRVRAKKKMAFASANIPVKHSKEVAHLNKIRKLVKKTLVNNNRTIIDKQAQTMADLYLPKCTSVRHSCDREVIGYITQGGFSFSEAKGVGLGYVILSSVLSMIKEKSNIILIRNTSTRKYRVCKLEILN